MSIYKLDRCPPGINSSGMTRVLYLNSLVAVFTSYSDAQMFIDMKDKQRAEERRTYREQANEQ